jgi:CheY-like chemotaxis protein
VVCFDRASELTSSGCPRVLVVDDDRAIRLLVNSIFSRNGYAVELAEDGAQAITRLKTNSYDVIVLDLMMPVVNGFEVLGWMRESRPGTSQSCVIVLTAAAQRDLKQLDQHSVYATIRKPFDLQQLLDTVGQCVRDSTVPRESATDG